ncbi:MAG: peptide chain release factor 1 [Clostridia bacterium]|nr:peptide chain release factor 1 [Clostridia bacterium]
MREKRNAIKKRYEELTARLCDPAVIADGDRYREWMKEQAALLPMYEAVLQYEQAAAEAAEADELAKTATDAEWKAMAQDAYEDASCRAAAAEEELKRLLTPRDPRDEKNVIIEIRGGTGGEESALFAASLYRMYTMYAAAKGFQCEELSVSRTELGGCKEITFLVRGRGAYSRFKFESGVHRVQRVPETESGGRIHTSAATVAVLPEADDVEITIDPGDLQIDTFRASGAGGQHINKTESAIRITHLPTGLVVECQDERSQYKNKDKAMRVLRSRLLEREQAAAAEARADDRRTQVGSGDRSERIRTYNFPQNRVTDHRIDLTLYKLDAVMNGALDEIIDALQTKLGSEEGR